MLLSTLYTIDSVSVAENPCLGFTKRPPQEPAEKYLERGVLPYKGPLQKSVKVGDRCSLYWMMAFARNLLDFSLYVAAVVVYTRKTFASVDV